MKPSLSVFRRYNELVVWTTALVCLFFMKPDGTHFTFCIFHWLGFTHCPGCGLGHAIHYALHGNFAASWNAHPLGIPAIIIIGRRVIRLAATNQNKLYGPTTTFNDPRPAA